MKRKGLSILLSALLVMILAVSFSVPVEAATLLSEYSLANSPYTVSVNFGSLYCDGSYVITQSSSIAYRLNAIGNSLSTTIYCDFYIDPSAFTSQPLFAGDAFSIASLFSTSLTYNKSPSDYFDYYSIYVSSVEFIIDGSSLIAAVSPTNSNSWFIRSSSYRPLIMEGNVCFPVVRVGITVSMSSGSHSSTGGSAGSFSSTFSVSPVVNFSFSSLNLRFFDSGQVTDSDLNNQTNSINNKIQQETQKQTNTLTNGYDNSGLNQSNSNLSGAIADYDSTESQITDSSVANIDAVEFLSPSSNATLLSSISLTTSWLQSLYVNSGDWSLLVTISLSLSLGLMLIGWFKYR